MRERYSEQTSAAYKTYLATNKAQRVNLTITKRQAYEPVHLASCANRCEAAWQVIANLQL